MTDTTTTPQSFDPGDWLARQKRFDEAADQLVAENKAALFAVLAGVGITVVTVSFDGYGDSGQIESLDARADAESVELPAASVELARPDWQSLETIREMQPLRDAIETMAYALLARTHGGWENNDGAYGAFTFDVAGGTIELDYNERYTASEQSSHSF